MAAKITPNGSNTYQPFVGFTYKDASDNMWHSITDLKIYRTSNGNRYNESITPAMTDKVVDVPGGDGQYYFGTTFKNRTFTVDYAFEELTKTEIDTIKMVFSGDGIHELVFDEDRDASGKALKIWSAKVTGTATMKHLCFEEDGKDVYKGEGSITFTCYYPYARSENKGVPIANSSTAIQNKGDFPAPFVYSFRRFSSSTDEGYIQGHAIENTATIYGIYYSDGSGYADALIADFITPREVGDGVYKWDSKTGILTYTATDGTISIVPVKQSLVTKVPINYPMGKIYFIISNNSSESWANRTRFGCVIQSNSEFRELYR